MFPAPKKLSGFFFACASLAMGAPEGVPPQAKLSVLSNQAIELGVDLNRGGAIVYLAKRKGPNLVNNYDFGRQIQLSFYSGPVPYTEAGQSPKKHWEHLGWNPVQTGDDFKNTSEVLLHENDRRRLYVRCRPMQWPLNRVRAECVFEQWLELDGNVVKARARLTNQRSDRNQYPARLQELPAVYGVPALSRIVTYSGSRPFTGEALVDAPKPTGKRPWATWMGTEGWAAMVDGSGSGLGVISPGRISFIGGFAGQPGGYETMSNNTAYIASQAQEILDHNITYEFRYELVVGTLEEIRARAKAVRSVGLPEWRFAMDRRGWRYVNAEDCGWPVKGRLEVRLEREDPQLIGPAVLWRAEEAPYVMIEAAFHTKQKLATVYWQEAGASGPGPGNMMSFPIIADDEFHIFRVPLKDSPAYKGAMGGLRFDPVPSAETGAWVKVRSIRLEAGEEKAGSRP